MDPFFILAIIISTIIFIIIPLVLVGLIYFILKKRTSKKIAVTICFILLTGLSYFLITDFYPTKTFYENNFEENTQLTLPKSKIPIYCSGNSSIYSFGDYNISYSYKFTTKDYEYLYAQLMTKGLQTTEKYLETDENEKILRLDSSMKIIKMLTKDFGFKNFDVLFMDDKQTIIFNSNKW
jgi:hypothetical protein